MHGRFSLRVACAVMGAALGVGCGGNTAPTVDAGDDTGAAVGRFFRFNPTGDDEDGDILTWAWTMTNSPGGSSAELRLADTRMAVFVPDVVGAYAFLVTVSDEEASSVSDSITITARNPPSVGLVADGRVLDLSMGDPVFSVLPARALEFDAETSTVAPGREIDCQWAVAAPADVSYELGGGKTSTLTFTSANAAPMLGATVVGTYTLTVTVGDDGRTEESVLNDFTTSQEVKVHVRFPPVIRVVAPSSVQVGEEATLDASMSEVGPGGVASFLWSIESAPAGSVAELTDTATATTFLTPDVPGLYEVSLVLDDGTFMSRTSIAVRAVP